MMRTTQSFLSVKCILCVTIMIQNQQVIVHPLNNRVLPIIEVVFSSSSE